MYTGKLINELSTPTQKQPQQRLQWAVEPIVAVVSAQTETFQLVLLFDAHAVGKLFVRLHFVLLEIVVRRL